MVAPEDVNFIGTRMTPPSFGIEQTTLCSREYAAVLRLGYAPVPRRSPVLPTALAH